MKIRKGRLFRCNDDPIEGVLHLRSIGWRFRRQSDDQEVALPDGTPIADGNTLIWVDKFGREQCLFVACKTGYGKKE